MKIIRNLTFIFCLICIGINSLQSSTTQEKSHKESAYTWHHIVNHAKKKLPLNGELKIKSDGYVYLKVSDDYIHKLYPMLELHEKGFKKPPYFRRAEAPGAHISVFYADEKIRPKEIGRTFSFTPKNVTIVKPAKGISYAVLEVDAPELEKLREKYGLGRKLHGHQCHITLAKKSEG